VIAAKGDWSSEAQGTADPGTVLSAKVDGIRVACGEGVLVIHELQRAGGKRLRAREFLAGTPIAAGARWHVLAADRAPR
jgi:methionyl-tRNA formyltransferase